MEDASEPSTPTCKRSIIRNPYKKSPLSPKRPRKSSKGHGKSSEVQEESGPSLVPLVEKKVAQKNITEFFKPVATWAIFDKGNYKEVQPEKVQVKVEEEEEEEEDPSSGVCVQAHGEEEGEKQDPERIRSEKDAVFHEAMLMVVEELLTRDEEKHQAVCESEEEHPAREPEFVFKAPKGRKLPRWMAMAKGKVKRSLPTIRRSNRVLERVGKGLANPETEWKPSI